MKVIPAIDLKGGNVVRLIQGQMGMETVYSRMPVEMAVKWAAYDGVETIHVVDLDGALEGRLINFEIVKKIVKSIKAKVEFGGGIRNLDILKMVLDSGVDKAVISTSAMDAKFLSEIVKRFRDKVIVGIDAKEGIVFTKGWVFKTTVTAIELAQAIQEAGIKTINYTDISKDGMLDGPNLESLKALLKATKIDIVASGGVSRREDLVNLKMLEKDGLKGVIIGKALYENVIDLKEAIEICSQKE